MTTTAGTRRLGHRLSAVLLVLLASTWVSAAADTGDRASGDQRPRRTVAMSQRVFQTLQQAQQLVEKKDYAAAQRLLDKLAGDDSLSNYEAAQTWNLIAYVYFLQERYQEATGAYEKILARGDIPDALLQSTLNAVAHLYLATGEYRKSIDATKRLMALVDTPSADLHILLGQAYFQIKDYRPALESITAGIARHEAEGKQPKENWLLMLRAIHYELKDFKSMVNVLKDLIRLYPKDEYLFTLAAVYSELGDTKNQLAVLEALYEDGRIDKPAYLHNLANLYLLHGVPYKAAKLLDREIGAKRLEDNRQNLRLLSQAWYQAREFEKAARTLERVAANADDGELYVQLAQTYMNLNLWQQAAEALKKALARGGLERTDSTNLMLGVAWYNLKRFEQAKDAFARAAEDERSAQAANQWIAYLDSEIRRREASVTPTGADSKARSVAPAAGPDAARP